MMKNFALISFVLILALISFSAFAQSELLIEDFEDGDLKNYKQGYWYSFNDNGLGGASFVKPKNWKSEGIVPEGYDKSFLM